VHDNTVEMADRARTGLTLDGISNTAYYTSYNNRFRNNHYILHGSSSSKFFRWNDVDVTVSQWKSAGQDTGGSFNFV
jgi:hypothetical protein